MTTDELKETLEIFGEDVSVSMNKKFKKKFEKKMLDLYKLLRSENMGSGEIQFKDGIVFKCEIDMTNWADKPVIDLTDAIEKEENSNDK